VNRAACDIKTGIDAASPRARGGVSGPAAAIATPGANVKLIDVEPLQGVLAEFIRARGWQRYHSPKNLAMALSVEVAELVEIFQWSTEAQSHAIMSTDQSDHVRHELADIFIYLTQLASALGVDLNAAVETKLALNAQKYPPLPGDAAHDER
jgi:NTP pyrophosphatase (non-canonical NTP hydrolase)